MTKLKRKMNYRPLPHRMDFRMLSENAALQLTAALEPPKRRDLSRVQKSGKILSDGCVHIIHDGHPCP